MESTPAAFHAQRWWHEEEHKESEIAAVVALHPEASEFVNTASATPAQPRALASRLSAETPGAFDAQRWWLAEEHKESEIAIVVSQHSEAARLVHGATSVPPTTALDYGSAAVQDEPTTLPRAGPSLRSQRRAVCRATGRAAPRTFLAATRYDGGVQGHELGEMDEKCTECGARMWLEEPKPRSSRRNPVFELCCKRGAVRLPRFPNPPRRLMELLRGNSARAVHYRDNIRAYNSAFGFTSSGASFDRSLANNRVVVYTYRIQGAVYHLISTGLLPDANEEPRFAQIYIFDTNYQIDHRNAVFPHLDRAVLTVIQEVLEEWNPFVLQFMANNESELRYAPSQTFELIVGEQPQPKRQHDQPTGSEVAVLMVGVENNGDGHRNIVIRKRGGGVQVVSQLDPRYDPLHFVLLLPFGHHGWSVRLKHTTGVTMNQFYCYHLMVHDESQVLHLSGRLTQEYTVDAYAKIEESRLMWVRRNQQRLRANLYQGLLDQVGGDDVTPTGRMVILPPSFVGGPRYMQTLYQDAMAIVRKCGKPDLFITMTCNPKWKEITRALLPGQKASDRFDVCCRVFRLKLKALLQLIIEKKIFGDVKGRVYVIEFQKRGLPHAHMLWILHDDFKPKTAEDIDRIVCAELPDPSDEELYDCVTSNMMHGPCGTSNPNAPCTRDGVCTKNYPKAFVAETQTNSDGYPLYRRRDNGRFVVKGSHVLDNRWVVPYNPYLCKVFNCHINVEICSSIQSVKYLYKYVYKGHDRIQARVASSEEGPTVRDEPQRYLDARYVSASEAFWRICEFSLQKMYPSVQALQIHDENMQSVLHREHADLQDVIDQNGETTLTAWMRYNRENPSDELAQTTLYCDFPTHFTWHKTRRVWRRRQTMDSISRVHFVSPRDTTRYFPGATSCQDLRTVDGIVYDTYQRAAQARGLLETDEEFDNDLELAAGSASPRQVRELFAMMLLFCAVSEPSVLLDKYMPAFAEDFMHAREISVVTDDVRQEVLSALESILFHNGSSLANFPSLPQGVELPSTDSEWGVSEHNDVLPAIFEAERLQRMLNPGQRALYDAVISATEADDGQTASKVFFVDGPASRRHVIATATSGIAALLLEGGRTLHSTFKVPIPVTYNSTCHFSTDSKVGRQIQSASLIIVDEAPMMHRHVYEALDRTIRDVMQHVDPRLEHVPFGGKTVVMGGDFRQMLPVIPKAPRSVVVSAALNRSPLWRSTQVFQLTTNVRVSSNQHAWSDYLLAVGEGRVNSSVQLPPEIRRAATLPELIRAVYGDFGDGYDSLTSKTILTPLNEDVVRLNNMVLDAFPGEVEEYRSADVMPPGEVENASLYPTEFLNTLDDASMPLHLLRLKRGCIVILLRNLNTTRGLCNGTRLRVDGFFATMLKVTVISQGPFFGDTHLLPRIDLYPSQTRLPFQFKRRQFPIRLAFAMTINKSQGQTLDTVGFYLPNQLFAHGQLYVTLSRTRTEPAGIVFCNDNQDSLITNVVYSEVFLS